MELEQQDKLGDAGRQLSQTYLTGPINPCDPAAGEAMLGAAEA